MSFGLETTGNEIVDTFKDRVNGKTFLITGPTPGGIGAETVISLARGGPKHLILAGRSQQKIQPLIDQISEGHPDVKVSFLHLDLGSQKSVRNAAKDVQKLLAGDKIDVLILNAAIMACPYGFTEDGIETQFGTNQVGHFLFGNLLLKDDLIGSRVVVVSSSASERSVEYLMPHLKDLSYENGDAYDPILAYGVSKASNILYAKRLAKLLKPRSISTFSLNPGSIKTNLQGYMTEEVINKAVAAALKDNPNFEIPVGKTLQQGCSTQLRAALDPSLEPESGAYLDHCQVKRIPEHEGHEAYMDEVWKISEQLVGEKFDF